MSRETDTEIYTAVLHHAGAGDLAQTLKVSCACEGTGGKGMKLYS